MQRVVAGTHKGRKLLQLPRSITGVRPSSSRVRGAIFDRLQTEVVGARVLDLFAGSGALAIEALSRGAGHATLVERQRALVGFLDRQLTGLGLGEVATVVHADARRFLTSGEGPYDLILIDPPYDATALYDEALAGLVERGLMADDAVVVIEYQRRRGRYPDIRRPASLRSEALREHGQTALEFLRYTASQPSSP